MTTVREIFGLACPRCDQDDEIRISACVMVELTPNGSIETGDPFHEWGPDHYCSCGFCGYEATVNEFITETCDEEAKQS